MKIPQWVEATGGLAVIISLIFVGLELRHNADSTSAQALLDLNAMANDQMVLLLENPHLNDLVLKASEDISSLSPSEGDALMMLYMLDLNMGENAFLFYERGILDKQSLRTYVDCYSLKADEFLVDGWKQGVFGLNHRFSKFVEEYCELDYALGSEAP